MAPRKTHAILLHMMPYRESSCIVRLYCEEIGMVHAIAKGIRRKNAETVALERGMVLEGLIYLKTHRSLQTLGSVSVIEFFPTLRSDLRRSAVRDAAFEFVLKALHPEDPHPDLYHFLLDFVRLLDRTPTRQLVPYAFWRFLVQLAEHLGVGPDFTRCAACGQILSGPRDAVLSAEVGGLVCDACAEASLSAALLPGAVRVFVMNPESAPPENLSGVELRRITRLFASWCRHHLELTGDYPALDFLCDLIDL